MFLISMSRTYGVFVALSKVLILIFGLSGSASAAEPIKVMALGDSLTQGYGLPQPDGLVAQLQAWFDTKDLAVEFINAGVSGDTTAGGLDRVAWLLDDDIQTVIVALGGNDMLRGINPDASRKNLHGILEILRDEGKDIVLVGMLAPPNYGPEYQTEFNAIFPELADEFRATYIESYFVPLMNYDLGSAELRAHMQADGIHPNAKGVTKIVEYLGPILKATLLSKL